MGYSPRACALYEVLYKIACWPKFREALIKNDRPTLMAYRHVNRGWNIISRSRSLAKAMRNIAVRIEKEGLTECMEKFCQIIRDEGPPFFEDPIEPDGYCWCGAPLDEHGVCTRNPNH